MGATGKSPELHHSNRGECDQTFLNREVYFPYSHIYSLKHLLHEKIINKVESCGILEYGPPLGISEARTPFGVTKGKHIWTHTHTYPIHIKHITQIWYMVITLQL